MNNITVKNLIQSNHSALHQAEKKVTDYILSRAHEVVNYSVTELSEKNHASEAAIVHTCRKLGYQGYYHLKIALAKEAVSPDNSYPDNIDFTDIMSLAAFSLRRQAEGLVQSTRSFNAEVLESILKLLANCDTIFLFAAESSNPLAVYGAYKFSQLELRTVVHVNPEMQINAAYSMGKRNLAIGISNSSSTNLMVDIFKVVKEHGVKSAYITNYIKSPLSKLSTHQLNTAVNDEIFFEASDSTRAPAMGVINMLALLLMCENKAHYEKYHTREEFLGSHFEGREVILSPLVQV